MREHTGPERARAQIKRGEEESACRRKQGKQKHTESRLASGDIQKMRSAKQQRAEKRRRKIPEAPQGPRQKAAK